MNADPVVLGVGIVDERGIAGSAGVAVAWDELGVAAPGTARTLREVFGVADPTYRRIDRMSRALVLAGEAAGLRTLLDARQREEAGLVVETDLGCLESDLRYARSLADPLVDAAVFPYTLPSTSLGELALRFGLRGPSVCLSVAAERGGESLAEARRMLVAGEVGHAVVVSADVFDGERLHPAAMRVVLAVVAATADGAASVAPWPGHGPDAFAVLMRAYR
ncbi:MAG: beta-ketoacyl synthase N-terminal-like domain-containing protein [Planctomycetota bacterium]